MTASEIWGIVKDRFDLEKQVTFYLAYHHNNANRLIHLVCIWPILITILMIVADITPAFFATPAFLANLPLGEYFVFNLSAAGALLYMVWYIALDYIAGTLGAFMVFWCYIFANYMAQTSQANLGVSSWVIALPLHIAGILVSQFLGHVMYERRRPAIIETLDQALITAPLFVLLDLLFMVDYRKELYERAMVQARLDMAAFHGKEAFEQSFHTNANSSLADSAA